MSNKKFTESFGSKGYYIALVLCAVAIGISGYLYYRNTTDNQTKDPGQSAISANSDQSDLQVGATQPMDTQGQSTEPSSVTDPVKKPAKIRQPVSGETISSYAMDVLSYNQTTRDWRTHNGIDIAAQSGTDVCAAADGTVYTVYEDESMGTTVVIRHEGGYVTTYASLHPEVVVEEGQTVSAGEVIGAVGNTSLSEAGQGAHLHFAVSRNGENIDPEVYLPKEE